MALSLMNYFIQPIRKEKEFKKYLIIKKIFIWSRQFRVYSIFLNCIKFIKININA